MLLLAAGGCARTSSEAYQPVPAVRLDTTAVLRTIVFGSCADETAAQPFWAPILAHDPDLFLFLGDNVYADTENPATMRATYARLGRQSGYRALRRQVPVLATWDDHDYGVNDGGADFPAREASQRAFMDFFQVPADAPMRSRPGIYHARTAGPPGRRVQVILLDTRYFRGPLTKQPIALGRLRGRYVPSEDTTATLLGEAQWAWLDDQLRQPADVRLLVSSIQAVPTEHGWEKWHNLPHERERLLGLIRETGAEGVVILSGDRHHAELSRLPADDPLGVGYPLYDLTASGLNRGYGAIFDDYQEPNRYRVGTVPFTLDNYGLVTVDWDAPEPALTLAVYAADGDLQFDQRVPLAELTAEGAGRE